MRTLILTAVAAHLTLPPMQHPEELSQLNECIQHRFQDRTSFGMRRILPNQFHGVRQFRPENAAEQAVVNRLEEKGYQVALYLAGRSVATNPALAPGLAPYRYGVQGPAYITRLSNAPELPRPEALFEESRTALDAFKTGQGYDIKKGDWTVALRPLRATNAACVQCHNNTGANVKLNDPLGVVMYVYRHPLQ
ncbi:MAG TPA: hypothetical protein VEU96_26135 [Bryobacteraceae bacterium]|nr:hypothetical protein [Bryobacteraceae bacterium]